MPKGGTRFFIPITLLLLNQLVVIFSLYGAGDSATPSEPTANTANTHFWNISGTFTIGGTAPDYATIGEAVTALEAGISGPVVFNIRAGSYNEQIVITDIPGTSQVNTITFQSETGDSSSVTILYESLSEAENYVISLDSADHLIFKDLKIQATGQDYATVIEMVNGADHNTFLNCTLQGLETTRSWEELYLVRGSGNNVNANDFNLFKENTFLYGSIGLSLDGDGSSNLDIGNRVEDNVFFDQGDIGIEMYYQQHPEVLRNEISNMDDTYEAGILIYRSAGDVRVLGNKLDLYEAYYGLDLYRLDIDSPDEYGLIANNMITITSEDLEAVGISNYYNEDQRYYHNSVHMLGDDYESTAYWNYYSERTVTVNNNFVNSAFGFAIWLEYNGEDEEESPISGVPYINDMASDHNNLITNGLYLGNVDYDEVETLADIQDISGTETNSRVVSPAFISDLDLHSNKGLLDGVGIPVPEVTDDFDGDARDPANPDLGADEFTTTGADVYLLSVGGPPSPFSPGVQDVSIEVINGGGSALTSFTVEWDINGVEQVDFMWTGNIGIKDTARIAIGTFNFAPAIGHSIGATVLNPNGTGDTDPSDNSLEATDIYTALAAGTYTIGGISPDFENFSDAVDLLNGGGGIDGPITFLVRDGVYNEQLQLFEVTGASSTNTVTFRSESEDSTAVRLTYNSTFSSRNYVLLLDGADHLRFADMTIESTNFSWGRNIVLDNGADSNRFEHNIIRGVVRSSSTTSIAVIYSNSTGSEDFNVFHNNRIENGSYGLYFSNSTSPIFSEVGTHLTDNVFTDQYSRGIEIRNQQESVITGNQILTSSTASSYLGLYLYYCSGEHRLSKNRFVLNDGGTAIYTSQFGGDPGDTLSIVNNFISVTEGYSDFAMQFIQSSYVKVYHNNMNMTSYGEEGGGVLRATFGTELELINNVMAHQESGVVLDLSPGVLVDANYNDLYTTGPTLVSEDQNYATLADWQQLSGLETNSISANPRFAAFDDLHVSKGILNNAGTSLSEVTDDIDGDPRNPVTPDIGADEFEPSGVDLSITYVPLIDNAAPVGSNSVKIVVQNSGGTTITGFTVDWEFEDVIQTPYEWTGSLAVGERDTVVVGNVVLQLLTPHGLSISIETIAEGVDGDDTDNQVSASDIYPAMVGTYTIGGLTPDFATFGEAASALDLSGVLGHTVFDVRTGTYPEQVVIPEIDGTGESATITFRSESGDSTDVTLTFGSTSSSSNYTLLLDGADHVTFQSMTMESTNTTYGRVVDLKRGATYNRFENNVLKGIDLSSTNDQLAVIYSTYTGAFDLEHENVFSANQILEGSFGIYFRGTSSSEGRRELGNLFQGNRLEGQYYMGIYASYQDSVSAIDNKVIAINQYTAYFGINLERCYGQGTIVGNDVYIQDGRYGIMLNDYESDAGRETLVANNFIRMGGSNSVYGLSLNYTDFANVVHNTVRIDNTNTSSNTALYINAGSGINLYNNIFASVREGLAIDATAEAIANADFNNYYHNSTFLGERDNIPIVSLDEWQELSGQELNSIAVDPKFLATDDLHVKQVSLYNAGTPTGLVTDDIDGDPRDAFPDIGADEFELSSLDAELLAIANPSLPFSPGLQPVQLLIRNSGQTALTSVSIGWEVNNITQTASNWTGTVETGDSVLVDLEDFNFEAGTFYEIKAWTSSPNGGVDDDTSSDTITVSELYAGVSGTFTIGGDTPDFASFGDAVEALIQGGVVGPVTFNVRDGQYVEQVQIPEITGAAPDRKIIFQSESQDSTKVTLTTLSADFFSNYVLELDGADHFVFRDLTIKSVNTSYGIAVAIKNKAQFNIFENNVIQGPDVTSSSSNRAVIHISSDNSRQNADQTIIRKNNILNGSYGIFGISYSRQDGNRMQDLVIDDNEFSNFYTTGIEIIFADNLSIRSNKITSNKSYNFQTGLSLDEVYDGSVVGNQIYLGEGSRGMEFSEVIGTVSEPFLVSNNMVTVFGSGTTNGIYVAYSQYVDVVHNNVLASSAQALNARGIYAFSGSNCRLLNNSFYAGNFGYVMYVSSGFFTESDYNNLYAEGAFRAYYGTVIDEDLDALRAISGKETNSLSVDPRYVSDTDLHVKEVQLNDAGTPIISVTTDFDGESRSTENPDIGADEFQPPAADAGISALAKPAKPFAFGVQEVAVVLRNHGLDTLTEATIQWTVDGVAQPDVAWTDMLPSSDTVSVPLGSFTFDPGTGYTAKFWTINPNGVGDLEASNDTLLVTDIYAALDGGYTIGGANPDFVSFQEAVDALSLGGIDGDVQFTVRDGVYDEQVIIPEIQRSDSSYLITFQSESQDSTAVTLTYSGDKRNSNYVLLLDGVDGILFKQMTIASGDNAYGRVVEWRNDATNTIFDGMVFLGATSNTTSTNVVVLNSTDDNNHGLKISNSRILGGSYGAHIRGRGVNDPMQGVVLENNEFSDQYYRGLYLQYLEKASVESNVLTTTKVYTNYTGIYSYYGVDGVSIVGNQVLGSVGTNGIFLDRTTGTSSSRSLVANNFIQIGGTGSSFGILEDRATYLNIYFNSINITNSSTSANNAGIYLDQGSNIVLRNNIVVSENGYVMRTYFSGFSSDYNNLLTRGANFAYYNNSIYSTFQSWQNVTSRDDNSVSIEPFFKSDTDLHVENFLLNEAGTAVSEVTNDIDGNARALTPDIGADEFIPPTEDASVVSFYAPVEPLQLGINEVGVRVFNNASAALKSVKLEWEVNGEAQEIVNWTGDLAPGESDSVTLGFFDFEFGTLYDIKAWSSGPNGLADLVPTNDSIQFDDIFVGLNGEYIIGGPGADFPNFSQAADALNERGVTGPVIFTVNDGIYNEQIRLGEIQGSSLENSITFRSASQDSTKVTMNAEVVSSLNYVVLLDGTDHVSFQDMTLRASSPSNGNQLGRVIVIQNEATNNSFSGLVVQGVSYVSTWRTSERYLIYSPSSFDEGSTFEGIRFISGSYGLYLQGTNGERESGTQITNCVFQDQDYRAVYMIYQIAPRINNNIINAIETRGFFYGLYLRTLEDDFEITKNQVNIADDGHGIYVDYAEGTSDVHGSVFNNFVKTGATDNSYGIYLEDVQYTKVYHNSVNITTTDTDGRAFYADGGSNLSVQNNIWVNSGGGYAMYTNYPFAFATSDYNDLYSTGAQLAYWSGDQPSLEALQSASGRETNSISIDPSFASATDLHIDQANLDGAALFVPEVTDDIDDQIRNVGAPDIGADEFGAGLATNDVGVVAFLNPESGCDMDSLQNVTVRVQNFGVDTISNFTISYVLNDTILVDEQIEDWELPGGKNREYSFDTPINVRENGIYILDFYTALVDDSDVSNDSLLRASFEHYVPVIATVTPDTVLCRGEQIFLHATGGDSYEWRVLGSQSILGRYNSYRVSPSTTTTYTVKVKSDEGCFASDTVTVDVNPSPERPVITFEGNVSPCNEDTITLTSSIAENIIWSNGAATQSIQVTDPDTYFVTHLDTINGCTTTESITLSYAPRPYIIISNNNLCPGESATLTVINGAAYSWSTGETTQSITVTPGDDTTYEVVILNELGCEYVRTAKVFTKPLQPDPQIFSISEDTEVCDGSSVRLTVDSDALFVSWSNGKSGKSITVSPSSKTTYTATASNGSCSLTTASESVTVDVLPAPLPPIIVATGSASLSFCDTDSIFLTASDATDSLLWSTGDSTQTIVVTEQGEYSVTRINEFGCTAEAFITLSDPPIPYITGEQTVCDGESTTLTINNGEFYSWSTGDSTRSITVFPDSTTTYYASIKVREGCEYLDSITVSLRPAPAITGISADTTICAGSPLELQVTGTAEEFLWSEGGSGNTIQVAPMESTTYKVTATNGCLGENFDDKAEVRVTVLPLPDKSLISPAGVVTICDGESLELSSSFSDSILWSTGEMTPTIVVSEPGVYSLSRFNAFECSITDEVIVEFAPEVTITTDGFSTLCRGDGVTLTVENASSQTWSTAEGTQSIFVSPDTTTTYYVEGLNLNGCEYLDSLVISILDPVPPDSVGQMIPAQGSEGASLPLTLSWSPAFNASHYDVFIWQDSTEIPESPFIEDVDQISAIIDQGLNYGAVYNWQVVAKNSCHTTPGPIQQFTLRELPNLVVTRVAAPKSAFSGSTIDVTWTVENIGAGNTSVKELWTDAIYLSVDSTLGVLDTYLGGASNLTALNAGQSYENTTTVTLPKGITQEYYILVAADHFKQVLETDDGNNSERSRPSMLVELTPPPDLQVTQIVRPTQAFSGQTINVSWTVTNLGTGPTEGDAWQDIVYLSEDSILRTSSAFRLGTFGHQGALEVDESYTLEKQFAVPQAIFGNYFIHVVTDQRDQIFEFAFENNNTLRSEGIDVILAPPPDLVVTDITAPPTASNGESITIGYTVQNQGGSSTPNIKWADRIYLSDSVGFDARKAKQIGSTDVSLSLGLDEQYTRLITVRVPTDEEGLHYLHVRTDVLNTIFEFENEDNNVTTSNPFNILAADLTVTSIAIPPEANSGDTIRIDYTVKNVGEGTVINEDWKDRIGIDKSAIYDPLEIEEMELFTYGARNLAKNDSITISRDVIIPKSADGQNFIYVETDFENEMLEPPGDVPNYFSEPIDVTLSPWPDLEVVDISLLSDTVYAGLSFSLSATITNDGAVDIRENRWSDYIFLSTTPLLEDTVTFLYQKERQEPLSKDDSYSFESSIKVEVEIPAGSYYLLLYLDYDSAVFEHVDDANNLVAYGPISLQSYPPVDLRADSLLVADTLGSGYEEMLEWSVTNVGAAPTLADTWYDALYLSEDSIWQGRQDLFLTQYPVFGPLENGESYDHMDIFTAPDGFEGDYYLILVADYSIEEESRLTRDSLRENNYAVKPVHIELSPSPNLTIADLTVPDQGFSGQPLEISWTVSNDGNGATEDNWSDRVYLSTDLIIDEDDAILTTELQQIVLDTGEAYTVTQSVTLPINASGNYILLLKTDYNDLAYEHEGEDDNVASSLLSVTRPLPADLVVKEVSVPTEAIAGEDVLIQWTLENKGSNPATGQMEDIVYFSLDSLWDIDDIVFGSQIREINLAPLSTEKFSMRLPLNQAIPEDYFVIVRTDSRNNIVEDDDDNNEGASASQVTVDLNELPLYVTKVDTLEDNINLYYKVIIPDSLTNETLLVTLNGDDDDGNNELYIQFSESPTRNSYDDAFDNPFFGDQEVLVPNLQPGTYFLLVYGESLSSDIQRIELQADIIDFEIRAVESDVGGDSGPVTVEIRGAKFTPQTIFSLEQGANQIIASRVIFNDPTSVFATFDLDSANLGIYNVVAEDTTGALAFLLGGFEVVTSTGHVLETNIETPASTRIGRIIEVTIQFANGGNVDIPTPERALLSLSNSPMGFTVDEIKYGFTDLFLEFREPGGPEDVLRPGALSSITIFARAISLEGPRIGRVSFRLIE